MAETPREKRPVYDNDHEFPLAGDDHPGSSPVIENLKRDEGIKPKASTGGRASAGSTTGGIDPGNVHFAKGDSSSESPGQIGGREEASGFYTEGNSNNTAGVPSKNVRNFFLGTQSRRRRTAFGALAGFLGGGGIFGLVTLSGPGQLVQLSHILQRNFSNSQTVSSSRSNQLFRYATADDIGETRLGILGRSVIRPQVEALNKLGITFDLNPAAGLNSASIDTEKLASKYPELNDMSESEKADWLNEHIKTDGEFASSDGGKTFTIDTSDFALSADNALVNGLVGELDNGLVVSALNTRLMSDYLNVSSLFHPLSRLAESKLKQATTAAARKQAAEDDEETADSGVEDTPAAVSATNDTESDESTFGDPLAKALLVTGAACFVRSISGDINTINRYRVELPSDVEALRFVSVGEQIESGQDVSGAQVNSLESSLSNDQGQTIWQGQALQATEGNPSPGGTDLPESYRQAFTGSATASTLKSWADSFYFGSDTIAGAACSSIGLAAQAVIMIGLQATDIFDGGLTSAGLFAINQSESFVASAAVMGLLHQVILNKTTDGKLAKDAFSGGLGGNLLAYGARSAANIAGAAQGLIPLASSAASTLSYQQEQQSQQQFESESIFARIFNIDDSRTIVGHLADSVSPSISEDLTSAIGSFTHIGGDLLSSLSSMFVPKTQAASAYNWGFPTVGIPTSMLNDPSLANPYNNATVVAGILDSQCLNSGGSVNSTCPYIQKAYTCFGDNIEKDPADSNDPTNDTWDVVPDQPVNTNDPAYIAANCGDVTTDPNWEKIVMFVVDTRNMQAMACYSGDDTSCSTIGASGGLPASTSSSTGTITPAAPATTTTPAPATPTTPAPGTVSGPVIKDPTHLVDSQWNFPTNSNNLTEITVNIDPIVNGPAISGNTPDGYFYSNEFYFNGNGGKTPSGGDATGYIGLQDEGNDSNGNTLPRSELMVIYGATSAKATSPATSECGNPSGEGQGCSLHLAYSWQTGHTYQAKITSVGTNVNGSDVWSAQITDLTTGVVNQLGTIDNPASYGLLSNGVVLFHERFSGPTDSCSDQMPSEVTFSNITANNGSLVATPGTPSSYNSPCGFLSNLLNGQSSLTSSYALSN